MLSAGTKREDRFARNLERWTCWRFGSGQRYRRRVGSRILVVGGVLLASSLAVACGDDGADEASVSATDSIADAGSNSTSEGAADQSESGAPDTASRDAGAVSTSDDSNDSDQSEPNAPDDPDESNAPDVSEADDTSDPQGPQDPMLDGGSGATEPGDPTLPPAPECEGESIEQDTTLDVVLHGALTLSGDVSVNGEALQDAGGRRGLLIFVNAYGDQKAWADLGSTGPGAYSVSLPPGRYSIIFQEDTAVCQGTAVPQMPCSTGRIVENLVLSEDAELDIDLPRVEVAGVVTSGGNPIPGANETRGTVTFVRAGGDRVQGISLQTTGDITFHKSLLAGTYDVEFSNNQVPCELSSLPCNSGLVARDVDLTGSRSFDIDIPVARVDGTVTVDGAALDTETSRGSVRVEPAADLPVMAFGNTFARIEIPSSGVSGYSLPVLPGRYDLYYDAANQGCLHESNPINPCVGGKQRSGIDVNAPGDESSSTTVDFDLSAVNVTVHFTVNGQVEPLALFGARALRFSNERGGSNTTDLFYADDQGPVADMRIQKGTYDIALEAFSAPCFEPGNVSLMPCNSGVLVSELSITEDTVLELDVKVARLSGAVTLNGGQLPDSAGNRGPLVFFREGESREQALRSTPLGMTGAATYTASVWPGEYEIWWADEWGNCEAGENPPTSPCMGGYLKTVTVTGDQVLDVDIPTVNVTGKVTYGDAALPPTADHGAVVFASVGAAWIPNGSVSVDEPVPGEYSISLIPGSYAVSYAGGGTCDAATEPGTQCAAQGLFACSPEAPSADAVLVVRPPAKPGSVTPPVVDPVDPEPDAGVNGPTAPEMILACELVLDHAITCTEGTDQAGLFTASLGFCSADYGAKYAACDTAATTLSRALECSNAPCEQAADCTTLVLANYALCRQ